MIESTARWHHLSSQQMIEPARAAFRGLQRKRGQVRAILPALEVRDRTVIIVTEGVDTGARMLGAVASVRDRGARRIVVAAPAGASEATWQLHDTADDIVIPHRPTRFTSVRDFYEDYLEVSDDLMVGMLRKWVAARPPAEAAVQTMALKIPKESHQILACELDLPPGAGRGSGPFPAVIFAHGFESDARSQRTVPISQRLAKRGIVGVRMDFTGHGRSEGTLEEATDAQMYRDLHLVHQSVCRLKEVDKRHLGLVGSGTGGLIALHYAANHPEFGALVIRGPVCTGPVEAAAKVRAPTLLIHAERDTALIDAIEAIDQSLACAHELLRIPQSSRLFNDPISRELMIDASVKWLADHLGARHEGAEPQGPEGEAKSQQRTANRTGSEQEAGSGRS
jgi:pimeloyl-ACP methyl ester carboxylesterase